jgi:hypothetical protein
VYVCISLTHLDAEKNCGTENKSDQQMDVISSAQWKKKKFKHNTVLARAIQRCISPLCLLHLDTMSLMLSFVNGFSNGLEHKQSLQLCIIMSVKVFMWWFVTEKELLTLLLLDLKTIHICDQL